MADVNALNRVLLPTAVGSLAGYGVGSMDAPTSEDVKIALTEHSRKRIEEAMDSLVRTRRVEELKRKVLGDGQTLRL
jgi:hypothetical protein